MRRPAQIPALLNTRGKFTRVQDGVGYGGWVVGEREASFLVTFDGRNELTIGDHFLCEFALRGWIYTILAVATQVSTKKVEGSERLSTVAGFNQVRTVSIRHGSGNERFLVRGMMTCVSTQEGLPTASCDVADVSDDGLALVVQEQIAPGTSMEVAIQCGRDTIQFRCEVRHCAADAGAYRVGLQIQHRDRIAHWKWQQFVSELTKASPAVAA